MYSLILINQNSRRAPTNHSCRLWRVDQYMREQLRRGEQSLDLYIGFLAAECFTLPGKSALLAGVTAQLFTFYTDLDNYTRRTNPVGAFKFMVFLCYASMIFNTSATVTSFMLIARLHRVPYRAARGEPPYPPRATVFANRSFLLQRYGFGTVWVLVLWHCESISASTSLNDFSSI